MPEEDKQDEGDRGEGDRGGEKEQMEVESTGVRWGGASVPSF